MSIMPSLDSLSVINWNGRSVYNKKLEFFDFLERHDVDVAIVTETWLQNKHAFFHPKFCCVRYDRASNEAERGGGVLIAVHQHKDDRIFRHFDYHCEWGGALDCSLFSWGEETLYLDSFPSRYFNSHQKDCTLFHSGRF